MNPTEKRKRLYDRPKDYLEKVEWYAEDVSELKADMRFILRELAEVRAWCYELKRTVDKCPKCHLDTEEK